MIQSNFHYNTDNLDFKFIKRRQTINNNLLISDLNFKFDWIHKAYTFVLQTQVLF